MGGTPSVATRFAPAPELDGVLPARCTPRLDVPSMHHDFVSLTYLFDFFGEQSARELLSENSLVTHAGELPKVVSTADFWQLCLNNVNKCNDEGHGCGEMPMAKSTMATIFSAVNQMDTLGEGLKRFAELLPVIPAGVRATVGHSPMSVFLSYEIAASSTRAERYVEVIALLFHCALRWMTAADLMPSHVRLSSKLRDAEGSPLTSISSCRSRHGWGVTIAYSRKDMMLPLGVRKCKSWAIETRAFHEILARKSSLSQPRHIRTVEELRRLIVRGSLSQQRAARTIGMSVATLQRRLMEAGTSFRTISKEVKRDKLVSLLSTDTNLDDIAAELGFAGRQSLWRTCHEWLGMSPSDYRHRQRQLMNRHAI